MARQVRFGDWHFCRDTGVLDRDGTVVSLEPRVAALLQHFLDHPGELLSRDQLVAEVWEGRVVSDDAIRRAVSSLRRALALDGSEQADHYCAQERLSRESAGASSRAGAGASANADGCWS